MKKNLEITGLSVSIQNKEILHNVSLEINEGETVALLGPNGSGKSTLANVLVGHPSCKVVGGQVLFSGADLLSLKPEERAKKGLFLSFQNPVSLAGVPLGKFLFTAYKEIHGSMSLRDFTAMVEEKCELLGIDKSFIQRSVNEGFSGGEKKRVEILQLAVLKPKLAILDETDSGLDVEGIKTIAEGIKKIKEANPEMAVLLITHYQEFLKLLEPNRTLHIKDGVVNAN